jgi:hypothetical protein
MTGALPAVLALVAVAVFAIVWRSLHARRHAAGAEIAGASSVTSLDDSTGAVRSVQSADVLLPAEALDQIWSAEYLERLARTYWRFLSRVTLGLIRVRYSEHERAIVLLFSPLKLLTFQAPEYEMDQLHGLVRWRIARGLLVAKRGRDGGGYLQIEVRRDLPVGDRSKIGQRRPTDRRSASGPVEAARSPGELPLETGERRLETDHRERAAQVRLHVTVEVANFYPSLASAVSRRLYNATQSRIHVIVTRSFLRSLRRLDLAESRVGRFRL